MNRHFISARAAGVDASGIRKVFDLAAKMENPINLSIGLPDFDVPDLAKQAAVEAIAKGNNRYTQTQGITPLRDRLRKDLSAEFGRDVGEILISSGVSGGLMLAIMSVIDPGDEVIFLDPYFVMYRHLLTLTGGKAVAVDSYPDFKFPAERVRAAITPRTKMIILNSPSNPTGTILSRAEIEQAVAIAREHDLLILSDEIYEPFVYEGSIDSSVSSAHGSPDNNAAGVGSGVSGASSSLNIEPRPLATTSEPRALTTLPSPLHSYEKTVVLRGFSKSHAMTGWRLGYVFGYEPVVSQMTKLQQYTYVCAPSPFQHAALAALDIKMSPFITAYRNKRDIAYAMLSRKFEVVKPGGAFYIFPKVPSGTATDFCTRAIEKNVLIIPGNVFSAQDTHFRISYATTDSKLQQGCEILLSMV